MVNRVSLGQRDLDVMQDDRVGLAGLLAERHGITEFHDRISRRRRLPIHHDLRRIIRLVREPDTLDLFRELLNRQTGTAVIER